MQAPHDLRVFAALELPLQGQDLGVRIKIGLPPRSRRRVIQNQGHH